MPVSIVDGTIEEAVPGRNRRGVTVFKSIRFTREDGTSHMVKKAVVKDPVASELQAGAKGRFYLFKAFDIGGVHGVRTADGRSLYAFPTGNQKIFLFAMIANILWIGLRLATDGEVPLLGLALLVLSAVGWFVMGKGEKVAKAQFDGDTGDRVTTRPTGAEA